MEAPTRRRLLDEVIYPYLVEKRRRGVYDWNDIALAVASSTGQPWDVVVVDETQDFSANQIRAIQAHLADDFSVTFVMDSVQRIYPRHFTWREVGIAIGINVRTLTKNHRNTKQISAFARSLVEDLPLEDDGALPDFSATTETGPTPELVVGLYSDQINYMIDYIGDKVDLTTESVAFLQPKGGQWFSYLKGALHETGIDWVQLTRASTWPGGSEAVALCTLHSAKGLEFDHVFLPGLNLEVTPHGDDDGAQLEGLRRLVAMGVGRARTTVMVGYKASDPSTVVGLFAQGTYNLVEL